MPPTTTRTRHTVTSAALAASLSIATLATLATLAFPTPRALAAEIDTNAVHATNAPTWLKASRVERVSTQIEAKLEWDIRKISLQFYTDQAAFKRSHGYDDSVLAFSRAPDNSVHMGPRIDNSSFDRVFGHELVHVILYQKYKGAVPKWLEEGMANYLSNPKHGSGSWKVDYKWLATQPAHNVLTMSHPFVASVAGSRYHYQASQALMEMIASHCAVTDLLQLSVGKKLESYLPTFCGINDINVEFRAWLKRKSK